MDKTTGLEMLEIEQRKGLQKKKSKFKGELLETVKINCILNEPLIDMSDNFSSQVTKLFHSFLSAKPLGPSEPHSNLKAKVISLSRELFEFHLYSKTKPPLDLSINKPNSCSLIQGTELDSYMLGDPKTLHNESFRTPYEKVSDSTPKNDKNLESSILTKDIISNPIKVSIDQIN